MDKKWRKSIFQHLPLDGRYFLTVAHKKLLEILQRSAITTIYYALNKAPQGT